MSDSFEDQLATAFVAKMAGMTLKTVDDNTVGIPKSGPAVRIDPASFLTVVHEQKKQEQQRQADELNRMAEQMYPLPEPVQFIPPPQILPQSNNQVVLENNVVSSELVDVLKSIDNSIKELVAHFKQS